MARILFSANFFYRARFGPFDPEDNPRTSQSRGKGYSFEEDEDRYDGPEYIRSRFSAKSGTRNYTTLSMYSVKSSRVLDDEEDLERCSSHLSERGYENGIERPTDELIDLEDSLDNRQRHGIQNGDTEVNGDLNGDRIINEYDENNCENSGNHQVDISNGRNSNEVEENRDQTEDVLERRLQALKSRGSPLLRAGSPEGNVKERRRSERFPDNTNLLANHVDNEKAREEQQTTEREGSPQRDTSATNNQGRPQQNASAINGRRSPQQSATAKRSDGSPQMSARAQRSEGSPERNLNDRRRSERFPDNENIFQKKNEREQKASTSVKKSTSVRRSQRFPSKDEALPSTEKSSTEQRKLKQSNSFRGRSRVPVRRFKVSKYSQEINASTDGKQKREFQKGPQSLDRNVPSRQSKEATTENKNQCPVTGSFPPRPPSRPRSHDGRYSVDSLYLPDDHKKPEVDNSQQQAKNRDDDIREDSLERPHLVARDSLYINKQNNNIEQKGSDNDGKESEDGNNQYGYSGYGYTTSQDR
ncbi:hypothetical protein LOTGIDRAFT_173955 [Lottia gigantea]|uniref:Uncharacterized protein n=1 Tax=Lottia gigantea TaxID=225164 RepID=V4AVJ5_LOTGI|nr:hypothetical protein LOTGIDRAFT_173955 [Lottia gigantea]ESO99075.1 hypothetical protein LOTGIDRAFT_173955 [Lottia gigantea]